MEQSPLFPHWSTYEIVGPCVDRPIRIRCGIRPEANPGSGKPCSLDQRARPAIFRRSVFVLSSPFERRAGGAKTPEWEIHVLLIARGRLRTGELRAPVRWKLRPPRSTG